MKYKQTCECCGNTSTAYTHSLNKPLVNVFIRFVELYLRVRRPVNPSQEISATHSQLANWQKLAYFGIIQKIDGQGLWVPTKRGLAFFYGEIAITTPVATINGNALPDDHEAWETHTRGRDFLLIHQIEETHYKRRPDYQAEKSGQTTIL